MTCQNLCGTVVCEEHAPQEPKNALLSRRGLLGAFAGVAATIGFTALGGSAMAASKTYIACKTTDIKVGGAKLVTLAGTTVQLVITRPNNTSYHAFSPYCTHRMTMLSGISGTNLICQRHGASYNTTTGAVTGGPAPTPLKRFATTVSGTSVKVTV